MKSVSFIEFRNCVLRALIEVKVLVVTLPHLIAMKRKVKPPRPQDVKDLEFLTSSDLNLKPSYEFTGGD